MLQTPAWLDFLPSLSKLRFLPKLRFLRFFTKITIFTIFTIFRNQKFLKFKNGNFHSDPLLLSPQIPQNWIFLEKLPQGCGTNLS